MRRTTIARLFVAVIAAITIAAGAAAQSQSKAPDAQRAREILDTAKPLAEQGDAKAQYNMGVLYDEGYGVTRDYAAARRWYERAAAQNYARAEHNLGVMYQDGNGVPPDPAAAARWFSRAAEHGEPAAQNNLSVMYVRGQGVQPDLGQAALWAARAARAGNQSAVNNLPHIAEALPLSRIDGDSVNVHSEPDNEGKVLRKANRDARVAVIDHNGGWSRVLFTGDYAVGWVEDALLASVEPNPPPAAADAGPVPKAAETAAQAPAPAVPNPSQPSSSPAQPATKSETPQVAAADKNTPAQPESAQPEPVQSEPDQSEPVQPESAQPEQALAQTQTQTQTQTEPEPEPTADKPVREENTRRYIDGEGVNVRRRATTDSDILFQVREGDAATVVRRQADWRFVRFEDGRTGWVAASLLARAETETIASASGAVTRAAAKTVKTPAPAAPEQSEQAAKSEAPQVAAVEKNTPIQPEPAQPESAQSEPAADEPAPEEKIRRYIDGEVVNVRRRATTNSDILFQVREGDAATVIRRQADWRYVRFDDGRAGWVAGSLLTGAESEPVAQASVRPLQWTPLSSAALAQQTVSNDERQSAAAGDDVPTQIEPAADKAAPSDNTRRYIDGGVVNIRRRASTESEVLFQGRRDDAVTVIRGQADWRYVRFDNGRTGWVADFLLRQ